MKLVRFYNKIYILKKELRKFKISQGCQFFETSSADGDQILFITEIFRGLVRHYLQRRRCSFRKPVAASAKERLQAWAKVFQYNRNKNVQRINSF